MTNSSRRVVWVALIAAAITGPASTHPGGHHGEHGQTPPFGGTHAHLVLSTSSGQELVVATPDPDETPGVAVSEVVKEALAATWLTDEERSVMRVFHGLWQDDDFQTPDARAILARMRLTPDAAAFDDPDARPEWAAETLLFAGETEKVRERLGELETPWATRLRGESLAADGDTDGALKVLLPLAAADPAQWSEDPRASVEQARARLIAARLRGSDAAGYKATLASLGRVHQQIDRLYWPAFLVEGELLAEKYSNTDSAAALQTALSLNPRHPDIWYAFGAIAINSVQFDAVEASAAAIEKLRDQHPQAELLRAKLRLVQNDPRGALVHLDNVLGEMPKQREALALAAAAATLLYDDAEGTQVEKRFAAFEAVSPGAPEAHAAAGRALAMFRQYAESAEYLEEAIRRRPTWSTPRMDLGLMEMQSGRDAHARAALREATEMDPFNKRAANSLLLLEELQDFETVETEHFVVRYRKGDDVLAAVMPERLEAIHRDVSDRFEWSPEERTVIELMPDHARFAVRITGMPRLFTFAACTGPVIAMEVPRDGVPSRHRGTFDWVRVMRHEYTHTVTLDQTRNRIPHWLTEGAAVELENAPRTWSDCVMLARALDDDRLFDLDGIKWGFVRPETPEARGLAYAQSQWMLEFMTERFGEDKVIELLAAYRAGARESDAIPQTFGVDRHAFQVDFLAWAETEVASWGLRPEPSLRRIATELAADLGDPDAENLANHVPVTDDAGSTTDRAVPGEGDDEEDPAGAGGVDVDGEDAENGPGPTFELDEDTLLVLRVKYPDHPDLLEIDLRRRLADGELPDVDTIRLLETYMTLRPHDPFPHRVLTRVAFEADDKEAAAKHLEFLDAREVNSPKYAHRLAELYRSTRDRERAAAKADRAVMFDPYDAAMRELAAAVSVEAGQLESAREHIRALTILEPDRPRHQQRLERIDALLAAKADATGLR